MNTNRISPLTLLAAAAVMALAAGCSSLPADNAQLEEARRDYRAAQENPQARDLAAVEMRIASDAVNKASDAWTRKEKAEEVSRLAYLAKQRVAIAQEVGKQKAAEQAVAAASAERDKMRLAARTNEADAAQRKAESSQAQADASQRQADASQRQAQMSQQQAAAALAQANEAQLRNAQLEGMLRDMDAKKTERGMVVTIGDVLFDTNRAELKSGGLRNLEKLGGFLKAYPQRRAMVEGFTDSVGSDASNQTLSGRRADAVRAALVDMGVGRERISTQGYGEAHPVASNDSTDGRQLNRRVEIVLSDEAGVIPPR